MANRLGELCAQRPALGGWCMVPSPLVSEYLGVAGFDYVTVDCQHGLIGYDVMVGMLQSMARTGTMPIVRVPGLDPFWIGKALDAGAEGVIVPMVSSRADAERAAAASRYFPLGGRSYGPVRSGMFLGGNPTKVNEAVCCLVMIETEQGVESADAICSTPGIDGIYVGPADLSITLGLRPPGYTGEGAEADRATLHAALAKVVAACKANGIVAGIHAGDAETGQRYVEMGFDMVTIAADATLLRVGAAAQLRAARGE